MSYKDCAACFDARTKPTEMEPARIVFDPRIQMPGTPTIEGHRLGAEWVAGYIWAWGWDETQRAYPQLTDDMMFAVCWWAGRFGPRPFRKRWGEWAKVADGHLWYGCGSIPRPPEKGTQP